MYVNFWDEVKDEVKDEDNSNLSLGEWQIRVNTSTAVAVSVYVVRAFIQQRALLAANTDIALMVARLEKKLLAGMALTEDRLDDHENQLEELVEAINAMRIRPESPRRLIGFRAGVDEEE